MYETRSQRVRRAVRRNNPPKLAAVALTVGRAWYCPLDGFFEMLSFLGVARLRIYVESRSPKMEILAIAKWEGVLKLRCLLHPMLAKD